MQLYDVFKDEFAFLNITLCFLQSFVHVKRYQTTFDAVSMILEAT